MTENPALLPLLAVLAGILSFTSPCTLPLVPGYLGYMSGVSASRGRSAAAATLFVLGFAAVFTVLGMLSSTLASPLLAHREVVDRTAGVVISLLGVALLGLVPLPLLGREGRPFLSRVRPGPSGAFFLGLAFAAGWTPCLGPVLAAILVLAGTGSTALQGAMLLLLYSLGLGVPFIAAALWIERFAGVGGWLRRRAALFDVAGGALLIVMGALVFTGSLTRVLAPALSLYAQLRWPPI